MVVFAVGIVFTVAVNIGVVVAVGVGFTVWIVVNIGVVFAVGIVFTVWIVVDIEIVVAVGIVFEISLSQDGMMIFRTFFHIGQRGRYTYFKSSLESRKEMNGFRTTSWVRAGKYRYFWDREGSYLKAKRRKRLMQDYGRRRISKAGSQSQEWFHPQIRGEQMNG